MAGGGLRASREYAEADLQAIRQAREGLQRDLAENSPKEMEEEAERLIRQYGLPEKLLRPLTYGLIEAAIQGWDVAERRTLGTEPLVFDSRLSPAFPADPEDREDSAQPPKPTAQLASSLMDRRGGRAWNLIGKWVRQKAGITDPAKAPDHSWRHRIEDELRAAAVPEDARDAILGHTRKTTARQYGVRGESLTLLHRYLSLIPVPPGVRPAGHSVA